MGAFICYTKYVCAALRLIVIAILVNQPLIAVVYP